MEVKWLEDFLSLVDTGNFSRSADLRCTTQPAFSRRIKSLEDWVGALLFDRRTHPITLTAAGERFRPTVEEIMRRLYQSREDIRQAGRAAATTIKFNATHSLSLNFFPGWIRSVEERHHVMSTRLDTDRFELCVQALLRGDCHFMLTHTHPSVDFNLPQAHFASLKVGSDILLPVTARMGDGTPTRRLPGTRTQPVDYLAYAETSAIGRAVGNMLAQRSEPVFLNRVFVTHLAAVLKSMTCGGRGVAWLPHSQVREELAASLLELAGDENWHVPVEICLFRSRDPLPPKSEEFWSFMAAAQAAECSDT
jgi:DNA-binding transcriptional LysR family regulator